ncbi:glutamate ABC transporter substrate-binding protein [Streptomyces albidoflavus]|uniref:glutamate ABC transporter substrate-binding protein n=1 Tax=Streptomyces albidoflavus TaxID=1886 RepID=UPI00332BEE70
MNRSDRERPRPRPGLRGWGGVTAMAVACALTAALVLLPLQRVSEATLGMDDTAPRGPAAAQPARAEACEKPEASTARPSRAQGPTLEGIKSRTDKPRKLIVGIDQNSYRWGYRDPATGSLEGFDIDLVRAIAQELMGDPEAVVFRAIPTNRRVQAIDSGEVDMVVRTMTITCDRTKEVAFSTAYFETGQQLLVPKGSEITGHDTSLKGRKVCAAAGSTALAELEAESHGADISTTVPNQLDCLVRLQLGEVDAIVTDSALAAGQAAQDPMVELVGEPFSEEFYGVAMHKDAKDLVARVNQVLVEYREDGWERSYDTWLKDGMGKSPGPPPATYRD